MLRSGLIATKIGNTSFYKDDGNNNSESKQDDEYTEYNYSCSKNHLMSKSTNRKCKGKCVLCDKKLCNVIDYECVLCFEYVCNDCNIQFKQLNQMLKQNQFKQFEQYSHKYNKTSKILKLV